MEILDGRSVLSPLDATLDIDIRSDGRLCSQLSTGGFGYLWGGARANSGLWQGKAVFHVMIRDPLQVTVSNTEDLSTSHVARVGVSWADSPVGGLGEVGIGKSKCHLVRACMPLTLHHDLDALNLIRLEGHTQY